MPIGVSTWGVQWSHRNVNETSDIFYLKLTYEMFWLFKWQNFPLFYAANMVAVSHSNMAAVFNKKSLLWGPQNSLIIFMLKIVKGNIMNALSTYLGSLLVWFDYKPRASVSLSKMAVNWVQNQLITNNELLDPVLFFRSVTSLLSPPIHPQSSPSSCMACNAKRN